MSGSFTAASYSLRLCLRDYHFSHHAGQHLPCQSPISYTVPWSPLFLHVFRPFPAYCRDSNQVIPKCIYDVLFFYLADSVQHCNEYDKEHA